jgi:tetratricopeptide (TPR) repeat protein
MADQAADLANALKAFNSLYGDEVKRVSATPSGADDVALAAGMLEAARTPGYPPVLMTVICEKAYELAMKDPSGYATAAAAMELVAVRFSTKRDEYQPKILAAQLKLFPLAKGYEKTALGEKLLVLLVNASDAQADAGDFDGAIESLKQALSIAVALGSPSKAEIQASYGALYARQQREKQVAALKARLAANPQDAATRKDLIKLYLADMENPAEALKLLDATVDEATRKFLPEAAKPIDQAPEAVCPALGDWYRGMADQTVVVASKAALLVRAKGYYERFLEVHPVADLPRTTAKLALAKVEEALAAIPPGVVPTPPPTAGKWIDCLSLVNPEKHALLGTWQARGSGFVCEEVRGKWAHLMIPVVPEGAYELEVALMRKGNKDTVSVYLPMGTTSCGFMLVQGNNQAAGLDRVFDKGPRDSEFGVRTVSWENEREYVAAIKVLPRGSNVEVCVTLDGKPYFEWRGPATALKSGIGELSKLKSPAVCASSTAVEVRRARLRMISGELKPATDLPPSSVAASPSRTAPVAADPRKVLESAAAPERINGARFFGVAAKAGGAFGPGLDGWYDYLQYIDPEKNTVTGEWDFTDSGALAVASGAKNGRLILPITAPGNYELEVAFTRTSGADAVVICLPVGRAACALLVSGEGGTASGLDLVNNKPYKDNETSVRPASLFNDTKYTVLVRVLLGRDEAEVVITLNGKPYIKWKGPPSALARSAAWKLPDGRCPGLGSCDSSVIFHSVRMRTLPVAAAGK